MDDPIAACVVVWILFDLAVLMFIAHNKHVQKKEAEQQA